MLLLLLQGLLLLFARLEDTAVVGWVVCWQLVVEFRLKLLTLKLSLSLLGLMSRVVGGCCGCRIGGGTMAASLLNPALIMLALLVTTALPLLLDGSAVYTPPTFVLLAA